MKIIAITGTPGVGKSALAKKLAKKLNLKRLDLSKHYSEIAFGYNKKKQCYDVDLQKLIKLVKTEATDHLLIVDSHLAHLLPKNMVELCLVLTCSNLKLLEKRLKQRKYSAQKIRENLDAEIFQVCLLEAKEKHFVWEFDVSKQSSKHILAAVLTRLRALQ